MYFLKKINVFLKFHRMHHLKKHVVPRFSNQPGQFENHIFRANKPAKLLTFHEILKTATSTQKKVEFSPCTIYIYIYIYVWSIMVSYDHLWSIMINLYTLYTLYIHSLYSLYTSNIQFISFYTHYILFLYTPYILYIQFVYIF